jgi:hypothetical protein
MGKINPVFIQQGNCLYRHIYGLFNVRILTIHHHNKQIVDQTLRTLGIIHIYSENVFPEQVCQLNYSLRRKTFCTPE